MLGCRPQLINAYPVLCMALVILVSRGETSSLEGDLRCIKTHQIEYVIVRAQVSCLVLPSYRIERVELEDLIRKALALNTDVIFHMWFILTRRYSNRRPSSPP
ncbi:hypothetical protein F4781DRAFT_14568 [Annulohypoxylon bovei var. microspora]|nr:hypothetical protein F4781DRAFT_14568 [Annulohypoxylon bovei var. microspora]